MDYGYKTEKMKIDSETYQGNWGLLEKLVNTVFSWVENWGFQILNTLINRLHSTWSNKMGGKFNCSLLWSWQSEQIAKVELTWNDNWVLWALKPLTLWFSEPIFGYRISPYDLGIPTLLLFYFIYLFFFLGVRMR